MPWLPAGGVPARVAVPLPLSLNVTPDGRAGLLVADSAAVGIPVVVTVNVPAEPGREGRAGGAGDRPGPRCAGFTVSVKLWVALEPTPFAAVIVIG